MSGVLLELLPKRVFTFSTIAVGTSEAVTVAEHIDVSEYTDCILGVRSHAADFSGGTIVVQLFWDGATEDDPTLTFRSSAPPISFDVSNSNLIPRYRTKGVYARGRYAALVVMGSRTSSNPLTVTLSAEMALRRPPDNGFDVARLFDVGA